MVGLLSITADGVYDSLNESIVMIPGSSSGVSKPEMMGTAVTMAAVIVFLLAIILKVKITRLKR